MGRDDDGAVLPVGELGEQRVERERVSHVLKARRLVEEDRGRALAQGAREDDALAFTTRELQEGAVAQLERSGAREGRLGSRDVLGVLDEHASAERVASEQSDLERSEVEGHRRALGHERRDAGGAVARDPVRRAALDRRRAARGSGQPGEDAQEGRLARAVGAEERDELAARDGEPHALESPGTRAVPDAHAARREERLTLG